MHSTFKDLICSLCVIWDLYKVSKYLLHNQNICAVSVTIQKVDINLGTYNSSIYKINRLLQFYYDGRYALCYLPMPQLPADFAGLACHLLKMMMMYLQKIYISFSMLEYCSSLDIWNKSVSQEALPTSCFFSVLRNKHLDNSNWKPRGC